MISKRIMPSFLKSFFIIFFLVSIIFLGGYHYYIYYLSSNLSNISENANLDKSKLQHNGENITFYNSNCFRCKEDIPLAYFINKVTFSNVEYRDVSNARNQSIEFMTHNSGFPINTYIQYKNNHFKNTSECLIRYKKIKIFLVLFVFIIFDILLSIVFSLFIVF